jgi:hypothetical protein
VQGNFLFQECHLCRTNNKILKKKCTLLLEIMGSAKGEDMYDSLEILQLWALLNRAGSIPGGGLDSAIRSPWQF